MRSWQRLQGEVFPATAVRGRPNDEPMSDGVLPFGMLELLDLADERVQDLG